MREAGIRAERIRRVLFIQATDPAGYPPLIHASMLMAEAGWHVTFLSAPIAGNLMQLPRHPRIAVRSIPERRSHVMGKLAYLHYITVAAELALRLQPDVVYASDPLGAGPGLLAARLARASLVYHEHDSPGPGSLLQPLARARAAATHRARLVVFPNEVRARIAQKHLGFPEDRLRLVWNLPRRAELPALPARPDEPLLLHYHGSITPDRLPMAVIEAVRRLHGRARLRIVGPEAPGAAGYVQQLITGGRADGEMDLVQYSGQIPLRGDLVAAAGHAHVGLALMPCRSEDANMRHMTGASNKPFDYMAAGLALLVSDLPEWRDMFVEPGYARVCDPTDAGSVAGALTWFLDHPEECRCMGAKGRATIESEWNYDTAFEPIMSSLS